MMQIPPAWKKLRKGSPEELCTLLAELDSAGLFLAPGETVEQFADRLAVLHKELTSLRNKSSEFLELIAQAPPVSRVLYRKAGRLTWKQYRFRADWVPSWYSSRQTGFFSAGVQLGVDDRLPLLFLHGGFIRKHRRLGYNAGETLAHELVHAVRIAFPPSAYEEYFPCRINRIRFRKIAGNLFRRWELPALFFCGLAAVPMLAVMEYPYWYLPLILPLVIVLREMVLLRRLGRAAGNLQQAGFDARPLLLRLSDREIFELAALAPEKIQMKRNESIRWNMLLQKFCLKHTL